MHSKPLGALLLAKLHDETEPEDRRRVWIRGEEPFDADGQRAIRERVNACFEDARAMRPDVLLPGWDLGHLNAAQTTGLVTELARYSLAESLPTSRLAAFRSGARSTMDGKEGRYPTPLNVAEMAVAMLDPGPDERVFDGIMRNRDWPQPPRTGSNGSLRMPGRHRPQRRESSFKRRRSEPGSGRPSACSAATWTRRSWWRRA